jgi:hypothetical protein
MTTHPLPIPGVSPEAPGMGPSQPSKSLRKAIDAKCRECIYDRLAGGTWRAQTHACELTKCALWPVRPKSESVRFAHE